MRCNGGGEPFVTYKYWMFGSSAWVTPNTGFIHHTGVPYVRNRGQWRKNHVIAASALGGHDVGMRYAKGLKCVPYMEEIWKIAEPHYEKVKKRRIFEFDKLLDHFRKVKARPFV